MKLTTKQAAALALVKGDTVCYVGHFSHAVWKALEKKGLVSIELYQFDGERPKWIIHFVKDA